MKHEAGLRYETCRVCGRDWNISVRACLPLGGYVCPDCRYRHRK